jgi:hypothetical protein
VSLTTCPKSYITGDSITLVEEYFVRRRVGRPNLEEMAARTADAFLILEEAVEMEMKHGRHDSRHAT